MLTSHKSIQLALVGGRRQVLQVVDHMEAANLLVLDRDDMINLTSGWAGSVEATDGFSVSPCRGDLFQVRATSVSARGQLSIS